MSVYLVCRSVDSDGGYFNPSFDSGHLFCTAVDYRDTSAKVTVGQVNLVRSWINCYRGRRVPHANRGHVTCRTVDD
jgi:hypothetical protein